MLENTLKGPQPGETGLERSSLHDATKRTTAGRERLSGNLVLCALFFVLCMLLTVTPFIRIPDPIIRLSISPGSWLATASSWLPTSLGSITPTSSASLEFFALIVLAFITYLLSALLVRRQTEHSTQSLLRWLIWLVPLVAGLIYVVTPAMPSHDILVYASYSRVLATYHANPYFVPIAVYPRDPFAPINYWANTVSAYGPIWTLVCGFFGWLLSPNPNIYVVGFRLFALAIDLLNIWLVGRTLQTLGRTPRTVTLGMLLYAWNPLVLLESSLGGHNDVLMVTFILIGVLLAAHAEKQGQLLQVRGYLPASVAFTLAALVKFTALPILAVYLLFLACKALRPAADSPLDFKLARANWKPALQVLLLAGLSAAVVALLFYGPFWAGHGLQEIVASFKNPPSAQGSENSFMRSLHDWLLFHPTLQQQSVLRLLTDRHFWDDFNYLIIAICLVLGASHLWRQPDPKNLVLVALGTMSAVLLTTPWFYSWYITWLIALACVCLPVLHRRFEAALLALALIFSLSALWTYLFINGVFGSYFYLVSLFTTIPPVCAFLLVLLLWRPVLNRLLEKRKR